MISYIFVSYPFPFAMSLLKLSWFGWCWNDMFILVMDVLHPSVRLSVHLSVTFSQSRLVFTLLRTRAKMESGTHKWPRWGRYARRWFLYTYIHTYRCVHHVMGVCCIVFDINGMFFKFFVKKFVFSFHVLCYFQHFYKKIVFFEILKNAPSLIG